MKNKLQVWDLDSTLIDTSHRYRNLPGTNKIDLQYWRDMATPENIKKDKIIRPTINLYKNAINCRETLVVICTARVMSQADFNFVNHYLPGYDHLFSREEGDNSPDWKLKVKNLSPFAGFASKDIFDDNKSVLTSIGKLGFTTWLSVFNSGMLGRIERFFV